VWVRVLKQEMSEQRELLVPEQNPPYVRRPLRAIEQGSGLEGHRGRVCVPGSSPYLLAWAPLRPSRCYGAGIGPGGARAAANPIQSRWKGVCLGGLIRGGARAWDCSDSVKDNARA
jgi:hypothetical protein